MFASGVVSLDTMLTVVPSGTYRTLQDSSIIVDRGDPAAA